MNLPVLFAALPEITAGGKFIAGFWTVWVIAMLVGFLVKAFKVDEAVLAYDREHKHS